METRQAPATLTLSGAPELMAAVGELAAREERSVSQLVRIAMREKLERDAPDLAKVLYHHK